MNYLLFMMSLMQSGRGEVCYEVPGTGYLYYGAQTNIPASEYIVDQLFAQQSKLNKIVILCSHEVLHNEILLPGVDRPTTTYNYYTGVISDWLRRHGYTEAEIGSIFFRYELENINPGSRQQMEAITAQMKSLIGADGEGSSLYIDYTGGLRSASMLLLFFARLMEMTGAEVKAVLYSNLLNSTAGRIEDCMDTYSLFGFLDALTLAQKGDLKGVRDIARKRGNDEFANRIGQKQQALDKRQQDQRGSVTAEESRELPVDPKMSMEDQAMVAVINRRLASTDDGNVLSTMINEGDVKRAASFIREKGLDELLKAGVIVWRDESSAKQDRRATTFFAYASYYDSYLRYVELMLYALKDSQNLEDDYTRYKDNSTRLSPAKKTAYYWPVDYHDLREFQRYFRSSIVQDIRDDLLERLAAANTDYARDKAFDAYDEERVRYMHAFYSSGFPFGNRYGNRSYNEFGKGSDTQCFDLEYQLAMDEAMKAFYPCKREDRESRFIELCAGNEKIGSQKQVFHHPELCRYFPPVCMRALFTVSTSKISMPEFGELVLLMNNIRLDRNGFVHGDSASSEVMKRTKAFAVRFVNWLKNVQ